MWWLLTLVAFAADRSAPPPVVPATPLALDAVHWQDLGSVRLGVVTLPESRKVALQATFHRGSLDLDGRGSYAAWLTGWLQDAATDGYSPAELDMRSDELDAFVWTSGVHLTAFEIGLEVPLESFDAAVEMFAEVLRAPSYPGSELKEYQWRQVYDLTVEGLTERGTLAQAALTYGWYAQGSGYGERPDLFELGRVKRRDLKARHETLLQSSPVTVLVVGDVSPERARTLLAPVFEGVGQQGERTRFPPYEARADSQVLAVHVPGAQAQIYLRTEAPGWHDPDRLPFWAASWALGGPFNSRLNTVLREERGLTYGAGVSYSPGQTHGTFTADVEVAGERVGEAMQIIREQLSTVAAGGVSERELLGLHRERVAEWNGTRVSAPVALSFYQSLVVRERTVADALAETEALSSVTVEQTREAAERWLGEARPSLWVIAGDRAVVEPQLEALGMTPRWLQPSEVLLGTWDPW